MDHSIILISPSNFVQLKKKKKKKKKAEKCPEHKSISKT